MPASTGLRLLVADLLRRPGSRRAVSLAEPVADIGNGQVAVPTGEPVRVDAVLENVGDAIVVRGTLRARYESVCSRCLTPVEGEVEVHVDELFEHEPLEGETYLLEHDTLDLEQAVRDALVLELPGAPLCRPDCAGLCPVCGTDRNEHRCDCQTDDVDPRWAALRSLQL